MIPNKQIGFSQEENLLWEISRQLDKTLSLMCTGPCPTTTTTTTIACINCIEEPVTIGTQTWTKCNLNVSTYRNGDIIPEITDAASWEALTTGAYCYYDFDSANGPIYGKLYNWYAVNDIRGLAPVGQNLPNNEDWTILTDYLGGDNVAGDKIREIGGCHWLLPNLTTNESGFTALGGGYILENGIFQAIKFAGVWWSTTQEDVNNAYLKAVANDSSVFALDIYGKRGGFSIRCLID